MSSPGILNFDVGLSCREGDDGRLTVSATSVTGRAYANGREIRLTESQLTCLASLVSSGIIDFDDITVFIDGDYYPLSFDVPL